MPGYNTDIMGSVGGSLFLALYACVIMIALFLLSKGQPGARKERKTLHFHPDAHVPLLLCFSAWGGASAYDIGLLENALAVPEFYPHAAVAAFVCPRSISKDVLDALANLSYVRVITFDSSQYPGMLMRMLPIFKWSDYDAGLVRDADSRLSMREVRAVEDWRRTGKGFHVMRDHLGHKGPINGGMFGALREFVSVRLEAAFDSALLENNQKYGEDMSFLEKEVYPSLTADNSVIHSIGMYREESWAISFPDGDLSPDDQHFVGNDLYDGPRAAELLGLGKNLRLSR
jgi:hypothetical protein